MTIGVTMVWRSTANRDGVAFERGCAENEKDDGGDEDDEDGVVMKTMEMRMMMIGGWLEKM